MHSIFHDMYYILSIIILYTVFYIATGQPPLINRFDSATPIANIVYQVRLDNNSNAFDIKKSESSLYLQSFWM